jgi:hypothetical protein
MSSFSAPKISLLLLLLLYGLATPVFALGLLANLSYRGAGGDNQETQSTFQQRYQLSVGPAVTVQPTSAITLSGGVGYRQTQRDNGNDGMQTVEQVSPFGNFTLLNDIFIARLSANTFTTMAGSDNSSAFWSGTLDSAWYGPLWPNLRFSYSEDFAGVNTATLFDDSNGKAKNTLVSVDWDLLLASLYYEYSFNELVSGDGESQNETTGHYVRLKTDGRFWINRIGYDLTQQYREVTTDNSVSDSAGDSGDVFFNTDVGGQTLSLVTDDSANVDEAQPINNFLLSDGIFDVSAVNVPPNDIGYFGFNTGSTEQIDALYLSLDSSSPPLSSAQAATLSWDLYVKKPLPVGLSLWDLVGSIPVFFNFDEQRFELEVNIDDPEIMVVTTNQTGIPLFFSELQAFRLITESGNFKTTSYKTTAGARFTITPKLNASLAFDYDHNDDTNNNDTVRESDKINWSGRLSWSLSPYISPSLGYSEYREERTGRPDDLNRLYSVTVSTTPLPSLSFSLGYTHNDRYADKEKIYKADSYNLFARFAVYPDLAVSWNASYSTSDTLTDPPDGEFNNVKLFTSRSDISARLYRNLTAFASADYSQSEGDRFEKTEAARASCTLSYRPSDILNLSTTYSAYFLDSDRSNELNASMELYLLRTYKSRLSLYANHTQADDTIDSFRMIGSWDISDYFTFSGSGNYSMAETNVYSFNLNLAMRL